MNHPQNSTMYHQRHTDNLYHHGVKGMKWGVRNAIGNASQSAKRTSNAISAANLEERISSVKRSMEINASRSDRRTRKYKLKNSKYKDKLERLKSMRDRKVSDLSPDDIDRGRAAYKTMKNTAVSVAVTAVSLGVGTVSVPASVATKLVGAGLTSVLNSVNGDVLDT